MKVGIRTVLPLTAAASLLSLSVSAKSVEQRAAEYAIASNRTQTEVLNIIKSYSPAIQQAKLDSLAYRDIFNTTESAKNTYKASQFENLANKMIGFAMEEEQNTPKKTYNMDIYNKLEKPNNESEQYQFFLDSYRYKELFKKLGIVNEEINEAINNTSQIIKPE